MIQTTLININSFLIIFLLTFQFIFLHVFIFIRINRFLNKLINNEKKDYYFLNCCLFKYFKAKIIEKVDFYKINKLKATKK